jgi:hypothetical protein
MSKTPKWEKHPLCRPSGIVITDPYMGAILYDRWMPKTKTATDIELARLLHTASDPVCLQPSRAAVPDFLSTVPQYMATTRDHDVAPCLPAKVMTIVIFPFTGKPLWPRPTYGLQAVVAKYLLGAKMGSPLRRKSLLKCPRTVH